ncbi:SDR family NAD(P)-dependent oxidoreductase, partial [Bordetella pertussis]
MDLQLAGKRVLITGASKGIGLACALSFAREGATPVLVARDAQALARAADAVREQTGQAAET